MRRSSHAHASTAHGIKDFAAAGWEIARKDVRNLGRDGRVPYQKRPHSDMNG